MPDIKKLLPLVIAAAACLPGIFLRLFHVELSPPAMATLTGASILGASFLLTWACDVAQEDIPQTLALAVVALIAVLPEYAVDMYFTWQAGQYPESDYAHYAIANMTGANRLIIGVAWVTIVGLFWLRTKRAVELEEERRTELLFLGLATLYAFAIPIKGSLAWYDGLVFVAIYAWYIYLASRRPCTACEFEGPAELIARLPRGQRRLATLGLFAFAAAIILACAEPFSENLVASGKVLGINEFLLVQWLAPIASEAPEFIVSILFVLRGHAGIALGSLLSAKLNQWTLLVGMIPGVYGVSSGSFAQPIPMNSIQMHEILLTAAQSLLAVVLLVGMRLSMRGAIVLFVLFIGQFLAPVWSDFLAAAGVNLDPDSIHMGFSMAYIGLALMLMAVRLTELRALWRGALVPARAAK